jgi:hypothetical protein
MGEPARSDRSADCFCLRPASRHLRALTSRGVMEARTSASSALRSRGPTSLLEVPPMQMPLPTPPPTFGAAVNDYDWRTTAESTRTANGMSSEMGRNGRKRKRGAFQTLNEDITRMLTMKLVMSRRVPYTPLRCPRTSPITSLARPSLRSGAPSSSQPQPYSSWSSFPRTSVSSTRRGLGG